MIRNLKILGLSVVAVLAMSAVAASAASAQTPGTFTAHEYPATITGEQIGTDVFTTVAGTVSCTHATYHGSAAGPQTSLTIAPSYTGCKAFGLFNATIDMNGCQYRFNQPVTEEANKYTGTVDVVCPEDTEITITTSVCRVTVPSQNGLSQITYENTPSATPTDVDVTVNIDEQITYTVDPGCATASAGTYHDGSYVGAATVDADNELEETIGVSISD
ncbi:MAG TPA: hypothetical protein VNP96_03550 [Solirubrobacterales bacterium]|nr:hypothetical protein [Solirubrobacterales bacterium]